MTQILIISPESWYTDFASKYHYSKTLANRGYKVYFLNPPQNNLKNITIKKEENVFIVESSQVAKGLKYYPKKIRNYLESKWLSKLENKIGSKFTTIWLFENSRFYDMKFAEDRLKIYHQMDYNQNFNLKQAVKSSDISFCVNDIIKNILSKYSNKVYKIEHGVASPSKDIPLSEESKQKFLLNKINAIYVGDLVTEDMDIDILLEIIEKFPFISFHFVGTYDKYGKLYKASKTYKNIILWGRVKSEMILPLLKKSDVTLLAYKVNTKEEKLQNTNSHKLMEYFLSGKVIVSTYLSDQEKNKHLIEMVRESNEFVNKFTEIVNNLNYYNSQEKQIKRIQYAKDRSYSRRLDKIISLLHKHNYSM